MLTFIPTTALLRLSTTFTASVPWLAANAPTGGATMLETVTGLIAVPTTLEVIVELIFR